MHRIEGAPESVILDVFKRAYKTIYLVLPTFFCFVFRYTSVVGGKVLCNRACVGVRCMHVSYPYRQNLKRFVLYDLSHMQLNH